jgi:hypothetical protein
MLLKSVNPYTNLQLEEFEEYQEENLKTFFRIPLMHLKSGVPRISHTVMDWYAIVSR